MAQVRGLLGKIYEKEGGGRGSRYTRKKRIKSSYNDRLKKKTNRTGKSEENLLGQHATKR